MFLLEKLWIPCLLFDNQHQLRLSLGCLSDFVKMQAVWELCWNGLVLVFCDLLPQKVNEDSADLRVFWWVIDFGVFRNCYHWRFLCERGFGFCMFCLVREEKKKRGTLVWTLLLGRSLTPWRRFRVFRWNPSILILTKIRYLISFDSSWSKYRNFIVTCWGSWFFVFWVWPFEPWRSRFLC